MRDGMLAFVAPYFGTLPKHFQLWLNSCAKNPEITWLLYTDDRTAWSYPDNVKVTYCALDDLRKRFQEKMDFKISLPNVKKLGDYKPLYGYLFEEELEGYRAWGHIDVGDVIYGNVGKFITGDLINQFDRLGYLGHLSIYRNTFENNRRFRAGGGADISYSEVFSSPKFYNFEELASGSIDQIWRHNGWTTGILDEYIADLSALSWAFRICRGYDARRMREANRCLIFEWNGGRLFGHEIAADGSLFTREFLYVHFKRRSMMLADDIDASRFLIAPAGFFPSPEVVDASCIRGLGRGRFPDPMWFSAKCASLKARVGR